MDVVNLIISLVSGAVGGNLGGAATSEKNLGAVANTIIGLIGGGGGELLLKALGVLATTTAASTAAPGNELDIANLLTTIGVSGVSGGALTAIIALIKDAVDKKS